MASTEPLQRLERLTLRLLHKRLEQAQSEHSQLKEAVRSEVNEMLEKQRADKLRRKLQQLTRATADLDGRLCYGAPPGWGNGGSASCSADGDWSSAWLSGTEVSYTVQRSSGDGRLEMTHSKCTIELQIYTKPFAHGGMRQAFYARFA